MKKLFAFLRVLLGLDPLPPAIPPVPPGTGVQTEQYENHSVRRCTCCGRFLGQVGACRNCGWKVRR